MKKYFFRLLLASIFLFNISIADADSAHTSVGVQVADAIIQRYSPTINTMTHHDWDHSNSVVLHGMEKIYNHTKNPAYLAYIKKFADDYVQADGSIVGLIPTLDGMHPGVLCLFLYEQTGDEKYKIAARTMRDYLIGTAQNPSVFQQTPEGGYWHKNEEKYRNVMSVDGLYMVQPFLVRYALLADEPQLLDVATGQILLVSQHSFNIKAKLPYHAWNYDKSKSWADEITGTGSQFWSRAVGWYAMALVDVLEYLPKTHKDYPKILRLYQRLAEGIKASQKTDGLWYQVVDASARNGNYPDVSGSGMIVYSLARGVKLKLLDKSYGVVAQRAWRAIKGHISQNPDGGPQINSVAPPMSAQDDYAGYIGKRPVSVPMAGQPNYPHGYMGVLMAAAEMETLP